jgi:hypothetical protein
MPERKRKRALGVVGKVFASVVAERKTAYLRAMEVFEKP